MSLRSLLYGNLYFTVIAQNKGPETEVADYGCTCRGQISPPSEVSHVSIVPKRVGC